MKAKIMVVDDTEGVRDWIGTILQHNGYEAMPKANAAQLLASFTEAQPDVILLDLVLPDGDGMELLPKIKKQWPDTEVIVLTGHATFDVAVEATKRGAYHFQNKPFDQKILLLSVERALEHRPFHRQQQNLLVERFVLEMVGSPLGGLDCHVEGGVPRQYDYFGVGPLLLDFRQQFHAVAVGQHQVQQDDIGLGFGE